MAEAPSMRASDAERERTVEHLREHALAGRLTVDELDERCAHAYSARTVAELASLLVELPAPVRRPPARWEPAPAVGAPGARAFTYEWHHPVAPGRAMDEALRHIAPALNRQRYVLVDRTETRLEFERSYRPGWVWVPVVLFPVIGLLALLHKVEERVAIDLEPDRRGGTRMVVRGIAPRRVRRAFAELVSPPRPDAP